MHSRSKKPVLLMVLCKLMEPEASTDAKSMSRLSSGFDVSMGIRVTRLPEKFKSNL
jgi:hypothetical protein